MSATVIRANFLILTTTVTWPGCGSVEPAGDTTTGPGGPASSSESSGTSSPTTGGESGAGDATGSTSPLTTGSTSTTDTSTGATPPGDSSDESGADETTAEPLPCVATTFCSSATEEGACRRELTLPDGNILFYWANLSLEPTAEEAGCNARVDRVVLVQHGNQRTPWSYFNYMQEAAAIAGVEDRTLIVAPWFPAEEDVTPPGFARWTSGGWKGGDGSIFPPSISSFSVYDHIVSTLLLDASVHPQLADVVFAGHSAGAQFAQRYAVASDLGGGEAPAATFRWLVANPSSYLYLDPFRWDQLGAPPDVNFTIPAGTECDDSYDDYKYGLANLSPGHYVAKHLADIPALYLDRDVTYLLGEDDIETDPDVDDLDGTCPAELQGVHRLQRGLVFTGFLDARYPQQLHDTVTVPGVGHSAGGMFTSSQGVAALFP